MWQQPLILSYFLLWCSPKLCSRPSTFHHVHYTSEYSLSLLFPSTTTFMQMILSSSSLSTHSTLPQAFLTFKTLFNTALPGWLLIFLLLTPLRRNSCSSDSKTNLPKYTTPTLLEISASSLTNILPSLTILHLSPKPVAITFVNFAVSGLTLIRQLPVSLLPVSFTPNLITVILSTINSISKSQLSRLQHIQNSLAHTVMQASKSCHITPILRSLH